MSKVSPLSKSAALLMLGFTVAEALIATASMAASQEPIPLEMTRIHATENINIDAYRTDRNRLNDLPETFTSTLSSQTNSFLLTQGLSGQCRAAARSIFIYAERSTANPIRALQADEQVTLAEASGRDGWIAIRSPISGFVQAKDLKPCDGPTPPPPPNRCRRVIYEEEEGLTIRETPNTNSARVGGVFFGDRVTLSDPPQFRLDDAGREWVRITAPTPGWLSNGFPQLGDINLKACF